MAEDLGRPAAGRETGPAPAARETRPTPSRSHRLLSVIVPVYNERNTVAEILRRMRSVDLPVDLEVVVVDDGSTDGTDKVLAALEDSTVRLVRHAANRGKAAAVRTGLEHARGQLVLIQDADLEYDPEDWPRLLDPVLKGKARVVYGSRFRGERMTMPLQRWVSNRALASVRSIRVQRPAEVVVVDNGSVDGSVEALASAEPNVRVVRPGRNLGYGAGVNRGAAACRADAEHLLVCNADVELGPDGLTTLTAALEADSRRALVGPRIENTDGTVYPSARTFPSMGDAVGHAALGLVAPRNRFTRRYRMLDWDHAAAREVDWVSGACLLV